MRYSIFAAILASGALAVPAAPVNERDVVVQTKEVVVVKTVQVPAGGSAPTPAPQPPAPAPKPQPQPQRHVGHAHAASAPAPAKVAHTPITDDYAAAAIHQHNLHRFNHSASALTWNNDLAKSAAALAAGCAFEHNVDLGPASNYGQNIAMSYPPTGSATNEVEKVVTNMWYGGEAVDYGNLYGLASPPMSEFDSVGHFTAMVWQATQEVGCHTQTCDSIGYFTVCNYSPAGNVFGQFNSNVQPPLGASYIVIQ